MGINKKKLEVYGTFLLYDRPMYAINDWKCCQLEIANLVLLNFKKKVMFEKQKFSQLVGFQTRLPK